MKGPGKYDQIAQTVLRLTGGDLVAILVLSDEEHTGFSVATVDKKLLLNLSAFMADASKVILKDLET